MTARITPAPGEPAPHFYANSTANPNFAFHSVAGRYIVLCFFGSASHPVAKSVLDEFHNHRHVFDDESTCFFGVSVDREDQKQGRVKAMLPGFRYFWDFDGAVSRLYGAISDDNSDGYRPMSLVLDIRLRIMAVIPMAREPEKHVERVLKALSQGDQIPPAKTAEQQAPILVVPRIFEPAFCRQLIELFDSTGGQDSGFMREIEGKTVGVLDSSFKRRRDANITDPDIRKSCMLAINRRLVPEIYKAYQFNATQMERYIVSCYDSSTGGFFRPHRDNTTKGTAHRRFAVSINLNAEEFEGGDLRFPEFGRQTYRPPTGGAVVFSCSLLHEATPVARGRRYAFLPFLYDDAAAKIRKENLQYLEPASETTPVTS